MSETDELYQEIILRHVRTPRHAGRPAVFDAEGRGNNPLCGDQVHVFVSGTKVTHESRGCAIMAASADLMADAVAGRSLMEITRLRSAFEAVVTTGTADPSVGDLNALAGVSQYRSRIRCATLPWLALAEALVCAAPDHALEDQKNG